MKTTKLFLSAALVLGILGMAYAQDADEKDTRRKKRRYGTYNDFKVDLGINNFLEDGSSPSENNAPYSVRSWGSWYVALKTENDTHIGGALHLLWGGDVSWYNFKFEDESLRINEGPEMIEFTQATDDVSFQKSKLTAAYVNASVVPMLKFGSKRRYDRRWFGFRGNNWDLGWNAEEGFRIGAGMYAGYRIASYTKYVTKEDGDKEKDKDKDGFYLNNFRYGVRGQIGFRGIDIFFNYDLNELFADNRGPELNAFSFGVVL
ncbi:MAG: hypothetical protein AAF149_01075 [Bacteroidota bacterium]